VSCFAPNWTTTFALCRYLLLNRVDDASLVRPQRTRPVFRDSPSLVSCFAPNWTSTFALCWYLPLNRVDDPSLLCPETSPLTNCYFCTDPWYDKLTTGRGSPTNVWRTLCRYVRLSEWLRTIIVCWERVLKWSMCEWSVCQVISVSSRQSIKWSVCQVVSVTSGQCVKWSVCQVVSLSSGQYVKWSV